MSTGIAAQSALDHQVLDIGGCPNLTAISEPSDLDALGATRQVDSARHTNEHRRQPPVSAVRLSGGPAATKTNMTLGSALPGQIRKVVKPSFTPLSPVKPLNNTIAIPSLLDAFRPAMSAQSYPEDIEARSNFPDDDEFSAIADSYVVPDDPVSFSVPPSNRPSVFSSGVSTVDSVRESRVGARKFDYPRNIHIQYTKPSGSEALRWPGGMVEDEPVPDEDSDFGLSLSEKYTQAMAWTSKTPGVKTSRARDIVLRTSSERAYLQDTERTAAMGPLREQIKATKWDNVPGMPDQASFVKLILGNPPPSRDASTPKLAPDSRVLTSAPMSPRQLRNESHGALSCGWWDALWSFIACSGCGIEHFP